MDKNNTYVLIHSPLVGGLTWSLVADQMRQRGLQAEIPLLQDSPDSKGPYWKQHADSVSQALANVPQDRSIVLVAHSGAGPLLPVIARSLAKPIRAYVFVDAGIPRDGFSRLDLMNSEDPEWAKGFQEYLTRGGRFPSWNSDDLHENIPDDKLRNQTVAEIRPRGLDFFSEPIPAFSGWHDVPCIYIRFSAPYLQPYTHARQMGWHTYELETGHFHMLVDAPSVTHLILEAVGRLD